MSLKQAESSSPILAEPDFYLKRYRIVLANTALVDRMTAADQRYEEMIALAVFNDFPGEMGGLHARMFAASALAVTNAVVERWIARPSSDPEPFAAAAVTELRRAAWVWQGQSTRSSQVIVLSDSDLSPAEIRRRLTSDASLDPDRAQESVQLAIDWWRPLRQIRSQRSDWMRPKLKMVEHSPRFSQRNSILATKQLDASPRPRFWSSPNFRSTRDGPPD